MMAESGRPLSVSLSQLHHRPDDWRRTLDAVTAANADGLVMRAQVAPRAIGVLIGLQATLNPLNRCPSYAPVAGLDVREQARRLAAPDLRSAILSEYAESRRRMADSLDRVFVLGEPPEYEPDPDTSVAATAAGLGRDPYELFYDLLLEDEGRALLYLPIFNYADGNLDAVAEMLAHPHTIPGLGDGGAHVGTICDGSFPTTLLAHWGRDRSRGPRFELPWLIRRQTRDTAEALGLADRGVVAAGYKADLNVVDLEHLKLGAPRMLHDLPAGGKRLMQRAQGYLHTVVSGAPTYASGEPTGALPGRVVRGPQPAPATT
jgi:N-acyl-D-aspartate/D-glutamate deacylase